MALGVSIAPPLSACAMPSPFEINDIHFADEVIVGRVTQYEIEGGTALLTLDGERSITGGNTTGSSWLIPPDEIKVGWRNSTFALPETMSEERRIFALRRVDTQPPPLRGPSGVIYPDPEGVEFVILQAPCSRPFIFPFSHLGMENIQAILNGDRPVAFDYHNPELGYYAAFSELRATRKVAISVAIGLLFWTFYLLFKNRRLKYQLLVAARSPNED